ncbi:hypothetical protein [Streptomyces malaysiensis]|uniref:hypothetical protein n=1 Tax=Streptomyces malaysiensis TaxID=92644 RepID=UPI002B2FE562|nr:hypothetical protein R8789_11345 [Streptomyces malaysiensis]
MSLRRTPSSAWTRLWRSHIVVSSRSSAPSQLRQIGVADGHVDATPVCAAERRQQIEEGQPAGDPAQRLQQGVGGLRRGRVGQGLEAELRGGRAQPVQPPALAVDNKAPPGCPAGPCRP